MTRTGRRCRRVKPGEPHRVCRREPGHPGLHRWWNGNGSQQATWDDADLCVQCRRWPRMLIVDSDRCAICFGLTPLTPEGRRLVAGMKSLPPSPDTATCQDKAPC